MVRLSFSLMVRAPIEAVWPYFSDFSNIIDWDPNTPKCVTIHSSPQMVGNTYELLSTFTATPSKLIYKVESLQASGLKRMIRLIGENQKVHCVDEMHFEGLGNRTRLTYKAEIHLKGLAWLFTWAIKGSLQKMAEDCKGGVTKVCLQKWGEAQ